MILGISAIFEISCCRPIFLKIVGVFMNVDGSSQACMAAWLRAGSGFAWTTCKCLWTVHIKFYGGEDKSGPFWTTGHSTQILSTDYYLINLHFFRQHATQNSIICHRSQSRCGSINAIMSFVQHQRRLSAWTHGGRDHQIGVRSSPRPRSVSKALIECPPGYCTISNNIMKNICKKKTLGMY